MTKFSVPGGATALVLLFSASTAVADVTPSDVWTDLKGYMESFGYYVSGSEVAAGGGLTINDLAVSMALPENAGSVALTAASVKMSANGDGTVTIGFPPVMDLSFDIDADGDKVAGTIEYTHQGMSIVVSGGPNDMVYSYAAASIAMSLAEFTVDGKTYGPETIAAMATLLDVAGNTSVKVGNLREIAQTLTASALEYSLEVNPPEQEGNHLIASGGLDSLAASSALSIPMNMDPSDMAAAIRSGFAAATEFSHSGGSGEFDFQDRGDQASGAFASAGGGLSVTFAQDGVGYGVFSAGSEISIQSSDLPFPVDLSMGESLFEIALPVTPSDQEQDFALAVTLGDFQMSDMLWSIVDGAGMFPHDPATISFDLSGKAKMFVDLMNPEDLSKLESGGMMPGELGSLALNHLLVQAVGAKLSGSGAFTFDNTDLATFGGVPRPEGSIDVEIEGANGLMDKLVQMGLLPEDQVMGARMMMSMFTVPGERPDHLRSKIEVNGQGHVLANGQRLK
jgi:hypothetical protein